MADYIIRLTDVEDLVVKALAAQRSQETGTPVTPTQLIQGNVSVILQPYVVGFQRKREDAVVAKFRAASEEDKAKVEAALPKEKA